MILAGDSGGGQVVFFSVVGSHDPAPLPGGVQGPALDLLEELLARGVRVGRVVLAWTPGMACAGWPDGYDARAQALRQVIQVRWPGMEVLCVPLTGRPNAAPDMLRALAGILEPFRVGMRVHVNASSGTPQMLEALKVLRGTGWFTGGEVQVWQLDRPEHREEGGQFVREATTPFLEETLRLRAGFAALHGLNFSGAQEVFRALSREPLELLGRAERVGVLADVAGMLAFMDALDLEGAEESLSRIQANVPGLSGVSDLVRAGAESDEAWIWLMWSRYDRARASQRLADALVWAVALHELLVVKLAVRAGLPDSEGLLRAADLPAGMFERLKAEVPGAGKELKFRDLKQKLEVLRAPSLGVLNVDVFDAGRGGENAPNPALSKVRQWRNLVLHQGHAPKEVSMDVVNDVVLGLLRAFPFREVRSLGWVADPDRVPVSAGSLRDLSRELQAWVG